MNNKYTYKEIIESNGFYIASPIGISMLPLVREGLDTIKLVKPNGRVKKYDCILYKRKDGKYIFHRVLKVRKNSYDLCGDNQVFIEHNVTDDMIIGVMEGIYKGEKYIEVTDPKYLDYVKKRVRSRKYRKIAYCFSALIRKLKRKKISNTESIIK